MNHVSHKKKKKIDFVSIKKSQGTYIMASTITYFTVLQFSEKSLLSNSQYAHSHLRILTSTCPSLRTRNCGLLKRTEG